jgi:YVTN family beta-propeller protein
MPRPPAGTVTFLFTDIEGSTRLVKHLGRRYPDLLAEHQLVLREAFTRHAGQEMDTQGDSFFVAFARARDASAAAVAGQRDLSAHAWPDDLELRVRMGLHTGEPAVGADRYTGLGVHRASRICDAGHGGQILLSNTTRELIEDDLPADMTLRDLGTHRLKDIDRPERLYQLVVDGLPSEFPPLRTVQRMRRRAAILIAVGVLILAGVGATLAVLLTQGGSSAVTVAPNSVAVVDPKTSRVVDDVPVGVRPAAIAVGEDAVWVANSGEGTLSRIDPETRKVVRTLGGVGSSPEDVAAGGGYVWVANGSDGTVSQIDPRLNAVVATLDLRGSDELAPDAAYAVAFGFGSLWVASGPRSVLRIDPEAGGVVKRIDVGGQAVDLAVGGGGVWAVTTGERAVRIEPRTNEIVTSTAVGGFPLVIAVGAGKAWVGDFSNRVWLINAETGLVDATVGLRSLPGAIGTGSGAGWIGTAQGVLSRVDPRTGIVVGRTSVAPGWVADDVAVAYGQVWVAVSLPES